MPYRCNLNLIDQEKLSSNAFRATTPLDYFKLYFEADAHH